MREIPSSRMSNEEFNAQYSDVPEQLKALWGHQMILLDEFERICNKYKLKWYADGGTLLGAIRHRGFIPWDDDIDVQMFIDDYEKFRKVAPKELKDPFFLQNWETEKGLRPWIIKLRKSDALAYTYFEESNGEGWNKGVFLDIFPLYYVPDSMVKRFIQLILLKIIRVAIHGYEYLELGNDMSEERFVGRVYIIIYLLLHRIWDYEALSKKYLSIAAWEKKPTKEVAVLASAPGNKNLIWDTRWFKKRINIPFMNRMIPAPYYWDERLRRQYGDYMTPKKNSSRHGGLKYKLPDMSEEEWLDHGE